MIFRKFRCMAARRRRCLQARSCALPGSCRRARSRVFFGVVQVLFDNWAVTARYAASLRRRLGDEKDWFTLFL
jgi:hypothetical protein